MRSLVLSNQYTQYKKTIPIWERKSLIL